MKGRSLMDELKEVQRQLGEFSQIRYHDPNQDLCEFIEKECSRHTLHRLAQAIRSALAQHVPAEGAQAQGTTVLGASHDSDGNVQQYPLHIGSAPQQPATAALAQQEAGAMTANQMLDHVVSSLRMYPHGGGDVRVMAEVERIVKEAGGARVTAEHLKVIIYDALKDQFPAEGAAMMVASCCAGPIAKALAAAAQPPAKEQEKAGEDSL